MDLAIPGKGEKESQRAEDEFVCSSLRLSASAGNRIRGTQVARRGAKPLRIRERPEFPWPSVDP